MYYFVHMKILRWYQTMLDGVTSNLSIQSHMYDFPGGLVVKNPSVNTGTGVGSLVWEDPVCCEAPKPMCHSY